MKKMISSKEAAARLGVSQLRVQQLCRQRRITGAKLLGRVWMIPADFEIAPGSRGPKGKANGEGMKQNM
jgi:excisionase family DNA binding protein